MIELTKRLQQIANWVPSGARVADIGSDHALLPAYLAERGQIEYAVAGEVNEGPYQAAKRQIELAELTHLVSVRKGDGLAVIAPNEVTVITIAGMGGTLISTILESGLEKLTGVTKLVLQPNVGGDTVRRWLVQRGWVLESETVLEEDGHYYEVLAAVRKEDAEAENYQLYENWQLRDGVHIESSIIYALGPHLMRQPSDAFFEKWNSELTKLDRIIRQIGRSETEEAAQKRNQLMIEKQRLEEVLACLRMDKPSRSS